jgi:hypothetical protein
MTSDAPEGAAAAATAQTTSARRRSLRSDNRRSRRLTSPVPWTSPKGTRAFVALEPLGLAPVIHGIVHRVRVLRKGFAWSNTTVLAKDARTTEVSACPDTPIRGALPTPSRISSKDHRALDVVQELRIFKAPLRSAKAGSDCRRSGEVQDARLGTQDEGPLCWDSARKIRTFE